MPVSLIGSQAGKYAPVPCWIAEYVLKFMIHLHQSSKCGVRRYIADSRKKRFLQIKVSVQMLESFEAAYIGS